MDKAKDKKIEKDIEKWIDLSDFVRNGSRINWMESVGLRAKFMYNSIFGELEILEYINKRRCKVAIYTNTKTIQSSMSMDSIKECNFGRFFIKSVAEVYPELIKYFVNKSDAYKHPVGSIKNVDLVCPICGTTKKQRISNLVYRGLSCPVCSDGVSYPNKLMFNLLTQLNANFKNEITKATPGFEWIQCNYRYDFYFEKHGRKYFIEMDGGLHRYEDVIRIDKIKDSLANSHGVEIIRINCDYLDLRKRFMFIKTNIVNSKLSCIFNLDKVDWDEIERKSIKNYIIIAANLWENEKKTIGEISKQIGVSIDATRKYLMIASNIKICKYTPELSHTRSNTGTQRSKRVALYKNDVLLNVFYSAKDLSRKSKELYGIYLNHSSICRVCRGDEMSLKGFTFQYIDQEKYNQLLLTLQDECSNLQEVI